jgi:hypothetical protein
LVETLTALVAPRLAPTDADWRAAVAAVRAGFRPGDLIVAAPDWSDQVMRLHLGDLLPVPVAGRMDSARFGRIWEIAQRGARAPETLAARERSRARHGALTLRLHEQDAARVSFDFVREWKQARVVRVESAGEIRCDLLLDRHQCPGHDFNHVRPRVLEIDHQLRHALYAHPVEGATVIVEWTDVPLARELAFASGLHNVWWRKSEGTVGLRVLVDGREIGRHDSDSHNGWRRTIVDTAALAGRRATVRFEITVDRMHGRHFGFAAEARGT